MRLYVTATFKGTDNRAEIQALCALVDSAGWELFVSCGTSSTGAMSSTIRRN